MPILHVDILVAVGGLIEVSVAKCVCVSLGDTATPRRIPLLDLPITTDLDLSRPDVRVKSSETVVQDNTVVMLDHGAHTIPNEEARNAQADQDPNDGKNRDPFLLGVLLL